MKLIGPFKVDFTKGYLRIIPHSINRKSTTEETSVLAAIDKADFNEQCQIIYLDKSVTLPPMSDNLMCVRSPYNIANTVFEPYSVYPGILMAKTLSQTDGTVKVRMVNTSLSYVTLYKNTPIGEMQKLVTNANPELNLSEAVTDTDEKVNPSVTTNDHQSKQLRDLVDLTKSSLSASDKDKFMAFLQSKSNVFAKHDYDLGCVPNLTKGLCEMQDHNIIRKLPYRMPVAHRDPLDKEIRKMLEHGIIQPAPQSAWSSPILMVKKQNGDFRLVCDYRAVNKITKIISFPLPHQDSVRELLSGQGLYTTIDLQKAYWQLELNSEEDKEKLAFVTYNNVYTWNRLPFGASNSPQIFQSNICNIGKSPVYYMPGLSR
jgi:hypothetical protein